MRFRSLVPLAGLALALGACTPNPSPGDAAYRDGSLGQGSFAFACDDGLACHVTSSGDAKTFPSMIATGSRFDVRFVPNDEQGVDDPFDSSSTNGIVITPVAPYLENGIDGLAAVKPGWGTLLATDATGAVVDYIIVTIVQPDALVVYDANTPLTLENPASIDEVSLSPGDTRTFRVVAEKNDERVAGALTTSWSSSDESILDVDRSPGGLVTVRAKKAGSATLTAKGAALETKVTVDVVEGASE